MAFSKSKTYFNLIRLGFVVVVGSSVAFGSNVGKNASVPARDAMGKLRQGNERFMNGKAKHPAQDKATRDKLASGQTPHTIILSCSDSRVAPEVLFDQGLGQVFVIRNAGNVPDHSAIASIEYAIEHLGAKLLVVLGHESCGAVKATLSTAEGQSAGSPDLDYLIKQIRPFVAEHQLISTDKKFRGAVQANVEGAARELLRHSDIIREAVESKGVMVVEAIYSLSTGKVDFNEWNLERNNAMSAKKLSPAILEKAAEEKAAHSH